MTSKTPRIAIVGGGITGLSAAFYLQKELKEKGLNWQVTLLESSDRLGGKIKTVTHNGFIMEQGPDSILERKTSARELIKELGLEDELVNNETGQAYILHSDKLFPIPEGAVMGVPTKLTPFALTPLVSPMGKVRALADLFLPRSKNLQLEDQSIGSFFRRRLGDEVVDRIIEPLLSGIYAGDIDKMSLMTILPQFAEMEKKYRSLILAMASTGSPKKKKGKAKGAFITLKKGLYSMVKAIEEQLTEVSVIKGDPLKRIEKDRQGYRLHLTNGEPLQADAVIMATPHRVTSEVLGNNDFLEPLRSQPVSVGTILLAYPEDAVHLDKEGTGFIVPRAEPYTITACTWINRKWPHTTPPGKALLRCYVGRDGEDDIVDKPDDELVEIAISDLKRIIPITSDPEFTYVTHWKSAMPQFVIEHQDWLKRLKQNMEIQYPGIFLIGSSYMGSGIPDCVEQGKNEAKHVIKYLS
ncbi:protoporphyrinogen oxidase [Thermoactinomyces mirandus]|uniref:Coproporphyrinogen III oxidase n=1 Tax=Thermoactinomyces mirandus TaxID=2756294 RepID=A0A7W1XSD9_9BACL|nr:protoporphyrinogen oxidase [Thermoactinomyces mirandus]MBA4602326.1 protoporphyrinogen oxidase [Thermoactinomyces mirandus]